MDSKPLSKEELLDAIRKMEQDPSNWARILGEIGIAGLGAGGAGFAAATLGTTTVAIPIVTALTGITMIAAAPVSLVAGAAVAGGAAAYGLAKLVTGSAAQDGKHHGKRQEILESLKQKLCDLEQKENKGSLTEKDKHDFMVFLKGPLEKDFITAEDAQSLMEQVTSGQLALKEAYRLLDNIISDKRGLPPQK
jgi:hypothetical protein